MRFFCLLKSGFRWVNSFWLIRWNSDPFDWKALLPEAESKWCSESKPPQTISSLPWTFKELRVSQWSDPGFSKPKGLSPSSLCYAAASHKLFILHKVVYRCQRCALNFFQPLLCPLCPHVSSLHLGLYSCIPCSFKSTSFQKRELAVISSFLCKSQHRPHHFSLWTWRLARRISFSEIWGPTPCMGPT